MDIMRRFFGGGKQIVENHESKAEVKGRVRPARAFVMAAVMAGVLASSMAVPSVAEASSAERRVERAMDRHVDKGNSNSKVSRGHSTDYRGSWFQNDGQYPVKVRRTAKRAGKYVKNKTQVIRDKYGNTIKTRAGSTYHQVGDAIVEWRKNGKRKRVEVNGVRADTGKINRCFREKTPRNFRRSWKRIQAWQLPEIKACINIEMTDEYLKKSARRSSIKDAHRLGGIANYYKAKHSATMTELDLRYKEGYKF